MCGIIGYTGCGNAIPKITKGLSVLEYRGYDSVGLAAKTEEGIVSLKCKGRISALEEKLRVSPIHNSGTAIGHTRWATHGGPSDINAHPHRAGRVVLVHNGIIENYKELRAELSEGGASLISETDTEVAAAILNEEYGKVTDPVEAMRRATSRMKGSYAFAIMLDDIINTVYAIRKGSPLLLAKGNDGYYLASDITALLPFTAEYYCLAEGEIAVLSPTEAIIQTETGEENKPLWSVTSMTAEAAQKGGYPHFMLKEIYEQPEAIVKSLSPRIKDGLPDFGCDGIGEDFWKGVKNIQIVACGSAYHAGLLGIRLLEDIASVPTSSHIASEYRYHPPISADGTVVIVISQSGETADSLAALRYAKERGLPTLAIVNAVETTIAREADWRIYTYAGPEIAVATTKGYCTQLSVLYLIATAIAKAKGHMTDGVVRKLVGGIFEDAPRAIEKMLSRIDMLRTLSERLAKKDNVFFIGRGRDYAMSEEGALKLKEISYIHAEAYAAGELKHGTISLIEENTPVIAISTEDELYDKTESNVREVGSRGAYVILLCRDDAKNAEGSANAVILLPSTSEAATLFASLTALQILAYETAVLRGCDIDRPRNLAKSVTVE